MTGKKTKVLKANKWNNLVELGEGWEPWKYQINHFNLNISNEIVCSGWVNFETKEKALEAWRRINADERRNKQSNTRSKGKTGHTG